MTGGLDTWTRRALVRRAAANGAMTAVGMAGAACGTVAPGPGSGAATGTGSAIAGEAAYLVHQAPGPRVEQYKKLAAMYQERNPKAQIDVLFTPQGEGHAAKLTAMASAGTPPETTFVAGYNLVEFAERSMLEPLDSLVARDKIDLRRFFEKTVELSRWTVGSKQQLFAIPLLPNPAVLFYNPEGLPRCARARHAGAGSLHPQL
jgi:ABC-type glycerol-3-phosphate transport system substrate-binding protein